MRDITYFFWGVGTNVNQDKYIESEKRSVKIKQGKFHEKIKEEKILYI